MIVTRTTTTDHLITGGNNTTGEAVISMIHGTMIKQGIPDNALTLTIRKVVTGAANTGGMIGSKAIKEPVKATFTDRDRTMIICMEIMDPAME